MRTFTIGDVIDRLYMAVTSGVLEAEQPIYAGIQGTDNFTPLVSLGIEHGEAYLTVSNPFPDTDTPEHRKADEILREAAHAAPVKPDKPKRIRVGESKKTLPNGKPKRVPRTRDGKPIAQKYDWDKVDWSKRNVDIAKELGTSHTYVSYMRNKVAKD